MELDSADVKEYFKRKRTVSAWWDPEEKPGLFKELYIEQRKIVGSLLDVRNKIVLDAGTGRGRFAVDFAEAGAEAVYASDLSEEMLAIAEKRAKRIGVGAKIRFQTMDIENLSYEANFFDIVCCMETFVHLPNPQQAMNELSRVAKPGGLVVGSVTLPIRRWYLNARRISNLDQLFEWLFTPLYQSKVYQTVIRPVLGRPALVGRPLQAEYFQGLFKNAGLSIQKLVYLGHPRAPHFVLVIARK
jgi:ubiquinone/menaquinone biosynthesis C-methylase UbiE